MFDRKRLSIIEVPSKATNEVAASPTANEELETIEEFNVCDLPPTQRHEQIFGVYAELRAGEAFILVNDHDPKPLYHQFEAEAGDDFRWEYRQQEPGEFRVLIGKGDSTTGGPSRTEGPDAPF